MTNPNKPHPDGALIVRLGDILREHFEHRNEPVANSADRIAVAVINAIETRPLILKATHGPRD